MHPAKSVVSSLGSALGKLSVLDCVYIIPEKAGLKQPHKGVEVF